MGKKNTIDNKMFGELHGFAIIQGLFLALLLIIFLSLVLASLVYFSSWQPSLRVLNLTAHISVAGGAIWAGRECEKKAWLHGIIVGVLAFMLLGWLGGASGLFVTLLWWRRLVRLGLIAMICGILGGLTKH